MEGKRLSDDSVLKTDPRYRKLEHLIQVRVQTEREMLKVKYQMPNTEGKMPK